MRDRNQKSKPKRYIAIVKIRNNEDGSAYCVKYRFDDLLKFTGFLDDKWSGWKWYNVFSNQGSNKGTQIENFTNQNRPVQKTV
ncbi:MAG: hypothetical protein KAI79_18680 [Bacteroidales bacterium]|nr:hypothetical protein [Bacteroidales bacterium]